MPLQLDDIRREFAAHLARQPDERFSMDKALAHVVTRAYEAGLDDASRLDTARLLHQFRELAKAADEAILVLNGLAFEDDEHHDVVEIKRITDALETWAIQGLLLLPESKVSAGKTAQGVA